MQIDKVFFARESHVVARNGEISEVGRFFLLGKMDEHWGIYEVLRC